MNRQIKTSTLLRRFAPYFKKYRGVLALDLFCASLTTVCELVLPLMVRFITERGMNDMASLTVALVLKIGGLYLVLRIIDAAANYYMQNIGHVMALISKQICAAICLSICRSCRFPIMTIQRLAS